MPAARRLLRRYRPIEPRARNQDDQDAGWRIRDGIGFAHTASRAEHERGEGLKFKQRRRGSPARGIAGALAQKTLVPPDSRSRVRWMNTSILDGYDPQGLYCERHCQ